MKISVDYTLLYLRISIGLTIALVAQETLPCLTNAPLLAQFVRATTGFSIGFSMLLLYVNFLSLVASGGWALTASAKGWPSLRKAGCACVVALVFKSLLLGDLKEPAAATRTTATAAAMLLQSQVGRRKAAFDSPLVDIMDATVSSIHKFAYKMRTGLTGPLLGFGMTALAISNAMVPSRRLDSQLAHARAGAQLAIAAVGFGLAAHDSSAKRTVTAALGFVKRQVERLEARYIDPYKKSREKQL